MSSKKLKIIPFKLAHIDCMNIRDYEMSTVMQMEHFAVGLALLEKRNAAVTIVYDSTVLAVAGYFEMWPGVCELMVLPSDRLHDYPIPFARSIKRVLKAPVFDNFFRIQIQAQADDLHNRWLKFLGFKKEGQFKKYDMLGNNFNMWARVK